MGPGRACGNGVRGGCSDTGEALEASSAWRSEVTTSWRAADLPTPPRLPPPCFGATSSPSSSSGSGPNSPGRGGSFQSNHSPRFSSPRISWPVRRCRHDHHRLGSEWHISVSSTIVWTHQHAADARTAAGARVKGGRNGRTPRRNTVAESLLTRPLAVLLGHCLALGLPDRSTSRNLRSTQRVVAQS